MSPLEIRILLHYHYSPYDFEDHADGRLSPASKDFIKAFLADGCLVPALPCHGDTREHVLGPRGQAFVDHICALPLPRVVWTMSPVTGSGPKPWRVDVIGEFELSDHWRTMSVAERAKAVREVMDTSENYRSFLGRIGEQR